MANNLCTELKVHLSSRHLHPTDAWLQTFISTVRPNTPIPALKQTCLFRLLATDITNSLDQPQSSLFPSDVLNAKAQSRFLAGPIVCQVLDIEDIGSSRWSQVESLEATERGETTKGREIIRVTDDEPNGAIPTSTISKGPFKILLQDAKGTKVYALDLSGTNGLHTGISMGTKLVIRNADVRRAVLMLEPGRTQILGGKIEALDKVWKEGRKERLMAAARAQNSEA
ncbi:RecQ mediated genome instability protein Rmi1 [Aaosphaeria arxii CBS 175.79]|uniref:RecQ-mediated genome instability protein 1 n=1 Tax=Aaosphaeria arxii CBS 175.79 TaxID=1450172 RepID=A0A6A5XZ63_9PLEO|nr:RecQ mediated genome instability protein Rmi1 [Aaosphaeria arxii CBS 175.79]KAF2018286.1 RecQ mediated genome instability protein Rmi1 [Aaosphaeria arxii CBS 175.79]